MDDIWLGAVARALRLRHGWRQQDVAVRARTSRASISRLERGDLGQLTIGRIEEILAVLDARLVVRVRSRGAELDRMLSADHVAMQSELIERFRALPGWRAVPEVSFSIYGERGIVDVLAWHPEARAVLVVELKTAIVDVPEMLGTLDRKRRLASRIAADQGWNAAIASSWLVIGEGMTNRRRVLEYRALLESALPAGGSAIRTWLRNPVGEIRAMSFLSYEHRGSVRGPLAGRKRVRLTRKSSSERGSSKNR